MIVKTLILINLYSIQLITRFRLYVLLHIAVHVANFSAIPNVIRRRGCNYI